MLLLNRVRLVNWHFFEDETVEIGQTTLFAGDNGTGKSTIIDAIQYALVARIDRIKFNAAAAERRAGRNLSSYCRCKIGTEGLDFVRKECYSHVILEFLSGISRFCAGIMIEASSDGECREHQWVLDSGSLDDVTVYEGREFVSPRKFKDRIKALGGTVCATKSDYNSRLTMLLKVHRRNFDFNPYLEAVVRSVSFSPFTSVPDFMCDYILEERPVDITAMKENLQNYKEAEREALSIEKRIARLKEIAEAAGETARLSQQIVLQEYFKRRIDVEAALFRLARCRGEGTALETDIGNIGRAVDDRKERKGRIDEQLQQARISLSRDDTYLMYEGLRKSLGEVDEKIASEERRAERRRTLVSQCEALLDSPLSADLDKAMLALEDEKQQVTLSIGGLSGRVADLKRELADLHAEKKEIEEGILRYPESTIELKRALEGAGIPSSVFADLLEVTDEAWHNAVEAWLNTQRFNVLVPESDFQRSLAVYNGLPAKTAGVGLPNTARMHEAEAVPGSLAEAVEAASPQARRYAAFLLGGVIRAELQDLKNHEKAITKACMRYSAHTASRVREEVYSRWFIGKEAKRRRLEEIAKRIDLLKSELDSALAEQERKTRRLDALRRVTPFLGEIKSLSDAEEHIACLNSEREDLEIRIAEIDTSAFEALKLQISALSQSLKAIEAEIEGLIHDLGGKQNRRESLRVQEEQEIAQERRFSSLLEGFAAEHLDLSPGFEKYYEERIRSERKAGSIDFEGIQERYESVMRGFYTKLENSRKRLMEMKRSYNAEFYVYFPVEDDESKDFISTLKTYRDTELPEYREKIHRARLEAEKQFREHFVSRLNEYITDARESFKEINYILNLISFGQDQYHFLIQDKPEKRDILGIIKDASEIQDYEGTLFESLTDPAKREEVERLFRAILENELDSEAVRSVCDYRQYFQYDIKIRHTQTMDPKTGRPLEAALSKVLKEKSGGETQTPYYVAIAASFYRFYKDEPEAVRLVLFDEAFNKMDDERIGSMIDFFKRLSMQVITAVPTEKTESIAPYMDRVNLVFRKDYHAYIRDYAVIRESV